MEFIDRVSAYPNRYTMTDENGISSHVILERADEPTTPGTPLNADTFNGMVANLIPGIESTDYPGCYYRMVNGKTEWINPPMVLDMECRTTERFMGKPVYIKAIKFGAMPSNSEASAYLGLDNKEARYIAYGGFCHDERENGDKSAVFSIPSSSYSDAQVTRAGIRARVERSTFYVSTAGAYWGVLTGYVWVKYWKTTD